MTLQHPGHDAFPDVVVALAVQPLVVDERLRRREIGAEPDVAPGGREVELCAGFHVHKRGRVRSAAVAHDLMRDVVLDNLEGRPALDALVADRRAPGQDKQKWNERSLHLRECPCGAFPASGHQDGRLGA